MKQETILGKIITEEDEYMGKAVRDAIHIAVAPVIANEELQPGQHVGFIMGTTSRMSGKAKTKIGIVDPFLKQPVKEGERFYLALYPKSITSLRHHWSHPDFDDEEGYWESDPNCSASESEQWLRAFASKWNMNYDSMIEGGIRGTYVTAQNIDIHSKDELAEGDWNKFWYHLEILSGKHFTPEHKDGLSFSCSC